MLFRSVKGVNPNYVVYVMVDEPRFPYFGGETAGPIFRRIMTSVLAHEGIAPDSNLIQLANNSRTPNQAAAPLKREKQAKKALSGLAEPPQALVQAEDSWLMPDLKGLTARDVMDLFSGKDLRLQLRGSGLVRAQVPAAGVLLKKGENIAVHLERETANQ